MEDFRKSPELKLQRRVFYAQNIYNKIFEGYSEVLNNNDSEALETYNTLCSNMINDVLNGNNDFDIENAYEKAKFDMEYDENVIETLVKLFAKRAKMPEQNGFASDTFSQVNIDDESKLLDIDTSQFEEDLRKYFKENYINLMNTSRNYFLSKGTSVKNPPFSDHNGEIAEIIIKHNLDPKKFIGFGSDLVIKPGLVSGENDVGPSKLHVFYATDESINSRITDLYSILFFRKNILESESISDNDTRAIKNLYVTYAKEHNIGIENKEALEEVEVDMNKVNSLANYINDKLRKAQVINKDMTDEIAQEIIDNYSQIMNLRLYNFCALKCVKDTNYNGLDLMLAIEKDCIYNSTILASKEYVYASFDYLKEEYAKVMKELDTYSYEDSFDYSYDLSQTNSLKKSLRKYIQENNIEGIDISIKDTKVDQEKIELIVDYIMSKCSIDESKRSIIVEEIKSKYPEAVESKKIDLDELVSGLNNIISDDLVIFKDFICIRDFGGCIKEVLYATKESLEDKINFYKAKVEYEPKILEALYRYANEHNIDLFGEKLEQNNNMTNENILENLKNSGFYEATKIRDSLKPEDSFVDILYKMSEGNPGAMTAIMAIIGAIDNDKEGLKAFSFLLSLDDMNIRGSQIWQAYEYLYKEDAKAFYEAINDSEKRKELVDFINKAEARVGNEKAVLSGASFGREKNPFDYKFTEAEVHLIRGEEEKTR